MDNSDNARNNRNSGNSNTQNTNSSRNERNASNNRQTNSGSSQHRRQIMNHPVIPEEKENPTCPVCLTRVNHRAYTDTCLHEFCRECIEQWSVNHNKCPVCREVYARIFYNIRSGNDYDEQAVAAPQANNLGLLITDGQFGILATPEDTGLYLISPILTPHGLNLSIMFMAPNQLFILNNMNPDMVLTRPENLQNSLINVERTLRNRRAHGTHPNFMRFHHHNHRNN